MSETPDAESGVVDDDEISVKIKSIAVSGESVELPLRGITAIVGKNNSGKSTLLKEIESFVSSSSQEPPKNTTSLVVEEVVLDKRGQDIAGWLERNAVQTDSPSQSYRRAQNLAGISLAAAEDRWSTGGSQIGELSKFFVLHSKVFERVDLAGPAPLRETIADPAMHPYHVLEDRLRVLREVSDRSYDILRQKLTLDRVSHSPVLRFGTLNIEAPPVDAVTEEYIDALLKLPPVSGQGDGVRSLVGLLLSVIPEAYPVVLIDEPEAFLHPPQAFRLGQFLAQVSRTKDVQMIVATHDKNILAGILADGDADLSVVRLERDGNTTTAHQLKAGDLRKLWSDPVMRYSNVLDGLFHHVAILAEADPDCRFYAASIEALNEEAPLSVSPSDILFVPTGGKDGMPKVAKALRAAHVKVVACVDLDVLDSGNKLGKLVSVFGGSWSDFKGDYDVATRDLRPVSTLTCGEVLEQIKEVLESRSESPWGPQVKRDVDGCLKLSKSDMRELKRQGLGRLEGESLARAENLLDNLQKFGICCVREGELESLDPRADARKGVAWLNEALARGAHREQRAKGHALRLLSAAGIAVGENR